MLDDILLFPIKFPIWLATKLREAALKEMTDESRIHEELLELQMLYEMEEITEEEYQQQEERLMEALERIRKIKEETQ